MNDRTRVTVRVAAPRELAFGVFTQEIDTWWRQGKRFRLGASVISLEPVLGGRLRETVTTPRGPRVFELGTVLSWEPPHRLVLAYRPVNFRESDPTTEIEVSFERAIGHAGEGTLVTLEHRGWARVRPDHPVRHGAEGAAFIASLGRFWGDLASAYRERVAEQAGPGREPPR